MNTPFNTGKVSIGSRYQAPVRVEVSRDMELLQTGLLHSRLERRSRAALSLLTILMCGALIGLAIAWMV
jgi:hypothetical protein